MPAQWMEVCRQFASKIQRPLRDRKMKSRTPTNPENFQDFFVKLQINYLK